MKVALPYGRTSLEVEVPENALVLRPGPTEVLADARAEVARSLREPTAGPPLADRVEAGQTVAIVISDITRPVPNQLLLPPLIDELGAAGIAEGDITIVNGTGLHRTNTDDELREMLGDLAGRYRIIQHDAHRPATLLEVGRSRRGIPVELCQAYVEADVRIVTGFVEPHLFAGYSGGAKGVMPGVAGAEIIMSNHGAQNLSHPRARWCMTEGNPVFVEMRQCAELCPPHFLLNVTLDVDRRITGVFSGDWIEAHEAAIARAAAQYTIPVPAAFDVVVVTNMGYPADTTLYQSVKGMSVAAEAVRDGGAIVLVAGCEEGVGGDEYVSFLSSEATPADLLAAIRKSEQPRHDQWQVQCQAMVQQRAAVYLHSSLTPDQTRAAHLNYSKDASDTIRDLVTRAGSRGQAGSVLVLPHGQLTVPVVGQGSRR